MRGALVTHLLVVLQRDLFGQVDDGTVTHKDSRAHHIYGQVVLVTVDNQMVAKSTILTAQGQGDTLFTQRAVGILTHHEQIACKTGRTSDGVGRHTENSGVLGDVQGAIQRDVGHQSDRAVIGGQSLFQFFDGGHILGNDGHVGNDLFAVVVQIGGNLHHLIIHFRLVSDESSPVGIVAHTGVVGLDALGLIQVNLGAGGVAPDVVAAGGGGVARQSQATDGGVGAGGGDVHKATGTADIVCGGDAVQLQLALAGGVDHAAVAGGGIAGEGAAVNTHSTAIGISLNDTGINSSGVVRKGTVVDAGIGTGEQAHHSTGISGGVTFKGTVVDVQGGGEAVQETACLRTVAAGGDVVQGHRSTQTIIVGQGIQHTTAGGGGVADEGTAVNVQDTTLHIDGTAISTAIILKYGFFHRNTHRRGDIQRTVLTAVVLKGDVLGFQFQGVLVFIATGEIHRRTIAGRGLVAIKDDVIHGHADGISNNGTALTGGGGVVFEIGIADINHVTGIDGTTAVLGSVADKGNVTFHACGILTNVGKGTAGVRHIDSAAQIRCIVVADSSVVNIGGAVVKDSTAEHSGVSIQRTAVNIQRTIVIDGTALGAGLSVIQYGVDLVAGDGAAMDVQHTATGYDSRGAAHLNRVGNGHVLMRGAFVTHLFVVGDVDAVVEDGVTVLAHKQSRTHNGHGDVFFVTVDGQQTVFFIVLATKG